MTLSNNVAIITQNNRFHFILHQIEKDHDSDDNKGESEALRGFDQGAVRPPPRRAGVVQTRVLSMADLLR
jgi:hypothetical protein